MRWPIYWSFSFSISPSSEHPGLISFRMDCLDLLVVQGTLKSLHQHHSSKASILWCSAFEIRLIIFFAAKDGKALYSQQKQDRELTGSDHELLIAKFRLKLKKVGKTTIPFRYDLNQIPYGYTVEMRNRFKGLDLIDTVPDELWMEVCDIVQETGIKIIPMEKKCKKAKWLSEEALQTAVK